MNWINNYQCRQVQDFLETDGSRNLILWGMPGTGKTYAMEWIMEKLGEKYPKDSWGTSKILFSSVDKYVQDMWFNYKRFEGNPRDCDKYFNKPFLLLDDLGTEIPNEDSILFIYKLLNERKKPLVISTNLTPDEISARYGERIYSRLVGNFTFVEFQGDDWRAKNFRMERAEF